MRLCLVNGATDWHGAACTDPPFRTLGLELELGLGLVGLGPVNLRSSESLE